MEDGLAAQYYLIALGSNQRHGRYGTPTQILSAAFDALGKDGLTVKGRSAIFSSRPVGPSQRRYANAAAIIETALQPADLLTHLQTIEAFFGRRTGQKWSRRVLDLDIILWRAGAYSSDNPPLVIPHPEMRRRGFVLTPALQIAGDWRDPISGLKIRHLQHRLAKQARARKNL